MTLLDLILIVILAASVATGFSSGFARGGIGFLASLVGLLAGFWFYEIPSAWVQSALPIHWLANVCGFCIILAVFNLIGSLLGWLLSKIFKWTGFAWLDRLLGACFGFVRGAFLSAAAVALLMAVAPRPAPTWMAGSTTLPWFLGASHVFAAIAPESVRNAFDEGLNDLRRIWKAKPKTAEL